MTTRGRATWRVLLILPILWILGLLIAYGPLPAVVLGTEVAVTALFVMWAWQKVGFSFSRTSEARKVPLFVRPGFLVLLFGVILHAAWGVALLISPNSMTTPMAYLLELCGQQWAGVVLLLVSLLAAVGIWRPGWQGLALGSFQNLTLWLSACAAIVSIVGGVYPDGTVRNGWFIFADQLPIILFAALHAISLIFYHVHLEESTE